jgi:hypothetical protein
MEEQLRLYIKNMAPRWHKYYTITWLDANWVTIGFCATYIILRPAADLGYYWSRKWMQFELADIPACHALTHTGTFLDEYPLVCQHFAVVYWQPAHTWVVDLCPDVLFIEKFDERQTRMLLSTMERLLADRRAFVAAMAASELPTLVQRAILAHI